MPDMSEPLGYCTVRGKGQITIPPDARDRLKLKEGDNVAFYAQNNGDIIMVKVRIRIEPD
jgi:AbrB family looped-hinge helix DNA binding protein